MNARTALALLGTSFLLFSVLPIAASGQSQGSTSENMNISIAPDGSLTFSGTETMTNYSTPGTQPSYQFTGNVTTSDGGSTAEASLTLSLPSSYLNLTSGVSETITGSGSYSNGNAQGTITVHAAAGVSSPTSDLSLQYSGGSSSATATGSVTLNYGTYTYGGSPFVLTQQNVSDYLSLVESQGLNITTLNQAFASPPYAQAGIQATTFTITPDYSNPNQAVVSIDLALTGNFSALPAAFAASSCQGSTNAFCIPEATLGETIFATVTSYQYSFGYSTSGLTAQMTMSGPVNFNMDHLLQQDVAASSGNLTEAQAEFLNTTTVEVPNLRVASSSSQAQSGLVTSQFTFSGLTLHPQVSISNGQLSESGFFDAVGPNPVNLTITTTGGATLNIPAGVPSPTSGTSTSASWSNVQGSALAPLIISGASTSASATKTSSTGTSPTSSSGGGGIPEFPFQFVALSVLTAAVLVAYAAMRRRPRLAVR